MAAEITTLKTPAESKLAEQFRTSPGAADRGAAFDTFATLGLPHRRIEAWHYTDLRSLLRDPFPPAPAPSTALIADIRAKLGAAATCRIVLVDGLYVNKLSTLDDLPLGVTVLPVLDDAGLHVGPSAVLASTEALGSGEAVLALNTAFLQGGVRITIVAGVTVAIPIEIVSVSSAEAPSALFARSYVEVGPGSTATIVERHLRFGTADVQDNHAFVFAVADGSRLHHTCAVEGFSAASLHIGTVLARLGAEAQFTSFTLCATLGTVRRQGFLEFVGEGSTARFNGVTLLEGHAHADTTLLVTHTAGHCESREYYKTILDDESTGVYQGKVVVAPGAQKTDGKMLSKAIFLADGASMFNKPELEIFADDVVCGHGATVGTLDETQLFYLRARGIPLKEAQSLLLNAFAADAIEAVADEPMRVALTGSVERWLAKRHL